jgi:chemotaxis protein methyltransferase CheR
MSTVTQDDFQLFVVGFRRLSGIDLAQYKRAQMERRIRSFVAGRGTPGLADYLERLKRDAAEVEAFLDRVTINVSQLWRNPDQWAALAADVLPELAARGRVRVWSAGCSYGAEAHTISALLHDVAPQARVSVLGTDIDVRMVARARLGIFDADDARDVPDDALARHFETRDDGRLQARRHVRAPLRFEQGDLLRLDPPRAAYDLVLCRNTVIYFTPEVRDALHARLASTLRPGGRLLIGATERVADPGALGLEAETPFCFRKES